MEHARYKAIYRRYASLYFVVGIDDDDENELSILEFIHNLVETLDKYFENVVRISSLIILLVRIRCKFPLINAARSCTT